MNTLFALLLLASLVGLGVGLWKPYFVKLGSRKKVVWIFGGATIILFILVGSTSPSTPQSQNTVATTDTSGNLATTSVASNQPVVATSTTPQNKTQTPASVPSTSQPPKKTSAPTQTAPAAISSETISQKNAVEKAMDYLGYSAFSHDGLVAQLKYDQFSQADAVYGADNSGADWNEQAAKKAQQYMSYSAFSRGGLITQLEYDKFTQAQAEYGATAVGL